MNTKEEIPTLTQILSPESPITTIDDDLMSSPSSPRLTNLIINYLPIDFDDHHLQDLFGEFGEIIERKVVKDRFTKKNLGYGFVQYSSHEAALQAIESRNGLKIDNKKIKVSFARPASDDIKNSKLYILNIPKTFTAADCRNLFAKYGDIIECRIVDRAQESNRQHHKSNSSHGKSNKNIAFVQFNLRCQAEQALELDGYKPNGSSKGLTVKFSEHVNKSGSASPTTSTTSSSTSSSSLPSPSASAAMMSSSPYSNKKENLSYDRNKIRSSPRTSKPSSTSIPSSSPSTYHHQQPQSIIIPSNSNSNKMSLHSNRHNMSTPSYLDNNQSPSYCFSPQMMNTTPVYTNPMSPTFIPVYHQQQQPQQQQLWSNQYNYPMQFSPMPQSAPTTDQQSMMYRQGYYSSQSSSQQLQPQPTQGSIDFAKDVGNYMKRK